MAAIELSNRKTLFDKLDDYYRGRGRLSPKEQEICERLELVFAIYMTERNKKVTVSKAEKVLVKKYGDSPSLKTLHQDLTLAEKLFTPIASYSKEFLRLIIVESSLATIKECDRRAKEKSLTTKDWTEIQRVKRDAHKTLIEAGNLNLPDNNLPDFSKLEMEDFILDVDPEIIHFFKNVSAKGSIDVTDLVLGMNPDIKDVQSDGE